MSCLSLFSRARLIAPWIHRFMYHSGGSKLELPVEFPFQLEAEEVCSTLDGERSPLELVALVCHYGSKLKPCYRVWLISIMSISALQGGHYTAFVKKPFDGSWIYCNDSHISQVDIMIMILILRIKSIYILSSDITVYKRSWFSVYPFLPAPKWWIWLQVLDWWRLWVWWPIRNEESRTTDAFLKC